MIGETVATQAIKKMVRTRMMEIQKGHNDFFELPRLKMKQEWIERRGEKTIKEIKEFLKEAYGLCDYDDFKYEFLELKLVIGILETNPQLHIDFISLKNNSSK